MNVWEYLCENKIEEVRFYRSEILSPYCETETDLGQERETRIAYNCFYRYENLFEELFQMNLPQLVEEYLTDMMLHYVMKSEFLFGMTSEEYHIQRCRQQIEAGTYGEVVRRAYAFLEKDKKHYVAKTLYKQLTIGESPKLYAQVITTVFDPSAVYQSRLQEKDILVYVPQKCTRVEKQVLQMLEILFLPLQYKVRVFAGSHPGIFDEEQTMYMDQIELY